MANLAPSAVTVNDFWSEGDLTSKKFIAYNVTLVLTGQGSTANAIPVSVISSTLGVCSRCTAAVKSDNTVVIPAGPSADGTMILLGGGASNAPADYTGTFTLTVWGQP